MNKYQFGSRPKGTMAFHPKIASVPRPERPLRPKRPGPSSRRPLKVPTNVNAIYEALKKA